MVSKTRDRLIEVARQLFARKGVENTTMLDIANASSKGRRTIYTYFRNKREIHQAVVERESEQLVARERRIQQSSMTAVEKLESFFRTRFALMFASEHERQSDTLSLRNLLEWNRVSKARRLAARKELEILKCILDEGVAHGEFDVIQARRITSVVVVLVTATYNPIVRQNLLTMGFLNKGSFDDIVQFLITAVGDVSSGEETSVAKTGLSVAD